MTRDFTRWLLSPRQPLGIDGWIASVIIHGSSGRIIGFHLGDR